MSRLTANGLKTKGLAAIEAMLAERSEAIVTAFVGRVSTRRHVGLKPDLHGLADKHLKNDARPWFHQHIEKNRLNLI